LFLILGHGATDRHHQRDRCIDLLVRTALQVAASVGLSHYIADTPRENRVPIVAQPASPHRCVELDNSWTKNEWSPGIHAAARPLPAIAATFVQTAAADV
jgi:hypothetical protein